MTFQSCLTAAPRSPCLRRGLGAPDGDVAAHGVPEAGRFRRVPAAQESVPTGGSRLRGGCQRGDYQSGLCETRAVYWDRSSHLEKFSNKSDWLRPYRRSRVFCDEINASESAHNLDSGRNNCSETRREIT